MAYPALLTTAPFVFNASFKNQDLRTHKNVNSIVFMAASATAAASIVSALETATTGQNTQLVQRIGSHLASATGGAYPTGSRVTAKATIIDAENAVFRADLRNWNTAVNFADFTNLLLGTVSDESTPLVTALSATPQNPATGAVVSVVQAVEVTKGF